MNGQQRQPERAVPNFQADMRQYITAGSLPSWEQIPQAYKRELVLPLAGVLKSPPELPALREARAAADHDVQP